MAVGGGAADSGENEAWGHADTEGQLLEGELHEAECMLIGEVQQIESLAQENKNKVWAQLVVRDVADASRH